VLVQSILSVARHFGLRVVAEGVETREQAEFLRERAPGIVYQGYLFARPEPDVDWLDRLAQPEACEQAPNAHPEAGTSAA
jgi:EAL domain-containing protein (putative c-di-GMP-specific phosphodiesterase class I)